MKIIVVGCGKTGTAIVESLVAEGHNITVVDSDARVIGEITDLYDVMGVCGNGADRETLLEAGVADTDLLVAASGADEMNMLSCFIAGRLGARHTIARIRKPEYNDESLAFLKEELDLSMAINPDLLSATELYHLIQLPAAAKVETFSRRNFEMVELMLREDSVLAGLSLSQLRSQYDARFLICVVQRGDEVYIPDGSFVLQGGDRIGLTATPAELHKLLRATGDRSRQARSVMILGGSRTAIYLAKQLCAAGIAVKIVEVDPQRCEELCELLPKVSVIHGDAADQELLREEGLMDMDALVAVTGMDEENILLSFYASTQGVPRVVTKVNLTERMLLAERLGLNGVISPRMLIADVLVRYARALQNSLDSPIETLYSLMDDRAEAIEFIVGEDERLINIPLRELPLRPNILLAGILRGRNPIIPSGEDKLLPGDRVVLVATGRRLKDLSDILK